MPEKKVVPVRFYPDTDADLIEWLEVLAAGEGNDTIKKMLRAGIAVSQGDDRQSTQPVPPDLTTTLDRTSVQDALESFLPRIREIVDASLASAHFIRVGSETTFQEESTASAGLLKGHLIGDDEDD